MKIAVNRCFGGFQLSDKAHERMIKLGIPLFNSYEEIPKNFGNKPRIYKSDSPSVTFGSYYSNLDDKENRTNPILIQTIEELGKEASGSCGNIQIIEIPENIDWFIDEYDGQESIHENHRSW